MQQAQRERAALNNADGKLSSKSKKEKQKVQKQLEAQQKAAKKQAENRQKAFKAAQRQAAKAGGGARGAAARGGYAGYGARGVTRADRGNPLSAIFSLKGAMLVGGVGVLYVAQKELLMSLVKYPLMILSLIAKKAWAILLKPILRQVLVMRSQSKGPGAVGGELPGGSY